jgi:hypothetical protein
MSRTRTLEEERSDILRKIEASREEYRRVLAEEMPRKARNPRLGRASPVIDVPIVDVADIVVAPGAGMRPVPRRRLDSQTRENIPAQAAVEWIREHPFICMAIVATVASIGPRRLLRIGTQSASAIAALSMRNSRNADAMKQLISSVTGFLQRRRH